MKSVQINSLPLKDVIIDLSKIFEVPYSENCQEFLLEIPPHIGEGFIRGIDFDGGLGIIQYDCLFHDDLEIQFSVDQVHPLKFLYVLKGILHHRFENDQQLKPIEQYEHSIVASDNHNGHVLVFQKQVHTRVNSLEIDRREFSDKMACEIKDLEPELEKLFKDQMAFHSFQHSGIYSLQMADLFKAMDHFTEQNFIRKLFLEGMAYQVLAQQTLLYRDDKLEVGNRSFLRLSELKQIEKIASIIESNINEKIDTVENLALEAGLNVNKLQEGFKYLYKTTVNGYVQKTRLDRAKYLLLDSDLSISEIVSLIGLSSKSYFSKIFKEQYHISPSQYRKKRFKKT